MALSIFTSKHKKDEGIKILSGWVARWKARFQYRKILPLLLNSSQRRRREVSWHYFVYLENELVGPGRFSSPGRFSWKLPTNILPTDQDQNGGRRYRRRSKMSASGNAGAGCRLALQRLGHQSRVPQRQIIQRWWRPEYQHRPSSCADTKSKSNHSTSKSKWNTFDLKTTLSWSSCRKLALFWI